MNSHQHRRLVAVAVATAVVDALTKLGALRWLTDHVEVGPLTLRITRNSGVAFSLGADQPASLVLLITGVAIAALTVAAWRGHIGGPVPAGLLVGGGLANLGDRVVGGSVIDLFDLSWWPVFNLADVAISTGVALLLLEAVIPQRDRDPRRDVRTPSDLSDHPRHHHA